MINKAKCISVGCPYYKPKHKVFKNGEYKTIPCLCKYDDLFLKVMQSCPLKKF